MISSRPLNSRHDDSRSPLFRICCTSPLSLGRHIIPWLDGDPPPPPPLLVNGMTAAFVVGVESTRSSGARRRSETNAHMVCWRR